MPQSHQQLDPRESSEKCHPPFFHLHHPNKCVCQATQKTRLRSCFLQAPVLAAGGLLAIAGTGAPEAKAFGESPADWLGYYKDCQSAVQLCGFSSAGETV